MAAAAHGSHQNKLICCAPLPYQHVLPCAENYDELLKMTMPAAGPEREFFLAMREFFKSNIAKEVSLPPQGLRAQGSRVGLGAVS